MRFHVLLLPFSLSLSFSVPALFSVPTPPALHVPRQVLQKKKKTLPFLPCFVSSLFSCCFESHFRPSLRLSITFLYDVLSIFVGL